MKLLNPPFEAVNAIVFSIAGARFRSFLLGRTAEPEAKPDRLSTYCPQERLLETLCFSGDRVWREKHVTDPD